jgi:hypothetical protein
MLKIKPRVVLELEQGKLKYPDSSYFHGKENQVPSPSFFNQASKTVVHSFSDSDASGQYGIRKVIERALMMRDIEFDEVCEIHKQDLNEHTLEDGSKIPIHGDFVVIINKGSAITTTTVTFEEIWFQGYPGWCTCQYCEAVKENL